MVVTRIISHRCENVPDSRFFFDRIIIPQYTNIISILQEITKKSSCESESFCVPDSPSLTHSRGTGEGQRRTRDSHRCEKREGKKIPHPVRGGVCRGGGLDLLQLISGLLKRLACHSCKIDVFDIQLLCHGNAYGNPLKDSRVWLGCGNVQRRS